MSFGQLRKIERMGSLVHTKTIKKLCDPNLHISDWKNMMAGQNFGISPILLATGGKSQFPANHVRFYTVQFVSLGWEGREKWQQGQK